MKAWHDVASPASLSIRSLAIPLPEDDVLEPADILAEFRPADGPRLRAVLEETADQLDGDPLEGIEPAEYAERAAKRGSRALAKLAAEGCADDPLAAAALNFARSRGTAADPTSLLASWSNRASSPTDPDQAYPWRLPFDAQPGSDAYRRRRGHRRRHWRPAETDWLQREPTAYGRRLLLPLVIVESLELVDGMTALPGAAGETAARVLAELQPVVEGDMASYVLAGDSWRDTFALWALVRRPHALARLHALAVAIATRYASLATRTAGLVCGTRYPFAPRPLTSASAHLALGLWRLGLYGTLVPGLLEHVAANRAADGSWADPYQEGDVLTTLAGAELVGSLDPAFDPAPTIEYLARAQEDRGWWRALDPEVPWLTGAIVDWLEMAERPFGERFRWPADQKWDRDRKTGIPGYAYFSAVARAFEDMPALASRPVDIAFCDLARFHDFNNAFGQDAGDHVLRRFAEHLASVPGARAIRDGGDEFLVVGAPDRTGLAADLVALLDRWAASYAAEYGTTWAVAPRVLVGRASGRGLVAARELLGRWIGTVKEQYADIPATGLLLDSTPS